MKHVPFIAAVLGSAFMGMAWYQLDNPARENDFLWYAAVSYFTAFLVEMGVHSAP